MNSKKPSGKIPRLLRLITLLQSGSAKNPDDIADELGVSRRTIFRDMKVLAAAGIPCYHDPEQGYRIAPNFFLPPLNLTVPETLALMLLGKMATHQQSQPLTTAALSAIGKLTATVPKPIRAACEELVSNVSINPGAKGRPQDEQSHYLLLQQCIDERRACRMSYCSPTDTQPLNCMLYPYALHFATRAWYVLGRTDAHKEVRLFKLLRIQLLEPADHQFPRPQNFSAHEKIGKAWSLINEGTIYDIDLEFSAMVGRNVAEVQWHPTQKHKLLSDGRCRMSFQIDGLTEISWWLCGYADQVVVRKPAKLRAMLQRMHTSAARVHSGHERSTLKSASHGASGKPPAAAATAP